MTLRLNDYQCLCGVREILVDEAAGEKPFCAECWRPMAKLPPIFRINMGACGPYGYYDDNLETYVSTNKQRKELMRQQHKTEKGATPKPNGDAWV